MTKALDLLVIGSGPGGYRAAVLGVLRGLEVAIVERGEWGGCCLNRGCVPKKAWHHSARILTDQRRFAERGIRGTLLGDLRQAWTHQHRVVARVRDSYLDYMKRLGIQSLQGTARFLAPDRIRVTAPGADARELTARHVVIATGSRPAAPPGIGTVPGRVLDSDMLFDQGPPAGDRVVMIGSGVVATEFAFILSALGKRVTWLARSRLLRRTRFSAQALGALQGELEDADLRLRTDAFPLTIHTVGDSVTVRPNGGDAIEADWVCLATGRQPNTGDLDLDAAGVALDPRGFVARDPHLRTSQDHIYAIGDCASAEMTANHALADATIAVENIVNGDHRRQAPERIPLVVYSALELARIGLDDESAEDAGHEPAVGFAAFESNPCALGQDRAQGFVRLLADLDSGELLGGEVVGDGAGELIHLLSLAPDRETALRRLASGVYNHPTRAEELINATETLAFRWGLGEHVFG
jgi:dihydrolipoamide dehydrogenase